MPRTAGPEELRQAYRARARDLHPDRQGPGGGRGADDMAALNAAWAVLRDPQRRRAYDAELRGGAPPRPLRPDDDVTARAEARERAFVEAVPEGPVRLVRGLPWLALLGVLAAIFVFTAVAASDREGDGQAGGLRDGRVDVGGCVSLRSAAGLVDEVECDGAEDGRVVRVQPLDTPCPGRSEAWRSPDGLSRVCVVRAPSAP